MRPNVQAHPHKQYIIICYQFLYWILADKFRYGLKYQKTAQQFKRKATKCI